MNAIITNGYAAKRAIIARLQQVSAQGQGGLGQAKVSYSWEGSNTQQISVFGGLVSFVQPGDEDLQEGNDVIPKETATISLHARAAIAPPPDGGYEAVEELLEQIGDEIADLIARERHIGGGHSFARIVDGTGDEEPVDDALAGRLSIHIAVDSYLTPT
jgi:hypothetical protein